MAVQAERISPTQAHSRMAFGATLVCAYEEPEKFADNHLGGAISLAEFQSRADSIPRDQEIIFYCA